MRCLGVLFFLALASGLAGCANHPMIDDVAAYSAGDVIRKIECEAQVAIRDYDEVEGFGDLHDALDRTLAHQRARRQSVTAVDAEAAPLVGKLNSLTEELTAADGTYNANVRKLNTARFEIAALAALADAEILAVADRVATLEASVPRELTEFVDSRTLRKAITGEQRQAERALATFRNTHQVASAGAKGLKARLTALDLFDNSTAGFNFSFDIVEDNKANASGTFAWPMAALGSVSVKATAKDEKARHSETTIKISSTFRELREMDCQAVELVPETRAHRYPLTGNVGMSELFKQYLRLNKVNHFTLDSKPLTEKLTFTTELLGDLHPSINLAPSAGPTIVGDVDQQNHRKDIHTVDVVLAPAATEKAHVIDAARVFEAAPPSETRIFVLTGKTP